jgi:hypothetical protein
MGSPHYIKLKKQEIQDEKEGNAEGPRNVIFFYIKYLTVILSPGVV